MRKNFGQKTYFFPLPVLIIGSYNEDGSANAMNAAWGGIWDYNQIFISLAEHQTTKNLRKTKAFTISFADEANVVSADYVGLVSGSEVKDKVEVAGLQYEKSLFVNAPIFSNYPLTLECKVVSLSEDLKLVGEIVNVSASENILDEKGEIDSSKLNLISYDPINHNYVSLGKPYAKAFNVGLKLKK